MGAPDMGLVGRMMINATWGDGLRRIDFSAQPLQIGQHHYSAFYLGVR